MAMESSLSPAMTVLQNILKNQPWTQHHNIPFINSAGILFVISEPLRLLVLCGKGLFFTCTEN
jgi:hypothetical protein